MPSQPPDRRPPMAKAMQWVSEISTGGFLLALPALGGWWVDGKLNSGPWCLIAGGAVGLVMSFLHILRVTGALDSNPKQKSDPKQK